MMKSISGESVVNDDDNVFEGVDGNELLTCNIPALECWKCPSNDVGGPLNVPPKFETGGESSAAGDAGVTVDEEVRGTIDEVADGSLP